MFHRVFDRFDAVVGEQVWHFADFATALGHHARRRQQEGRLHARPPAEGCRPRAAPALARRRVSGRDRASQPTRSARRPGAAQYLGYGAGDVANNLAFSMASVFLLLYYTDVVGIAAATVGNAVLVVRVFGGFADLFAGRIVDQTNTRWGRFRPYLLFAAIPLLLLNVAVFSVPGPGRHRHARLRLVTYVLFGSPTASSTSRTGRWRRR